MKERHGEGRSVQEGKTDGRERGGDDSCKLQMGTNSYIDQATWHADAQYDHCICVCFQ